MYKKILITGAGGYIGSIATYLLLQNGYKVIAVDNFSRGYKKPLNTLKKIFKENLTICKADLLDDLTPIFSNEKIDAIIHYAAYCVVDESMRDPYKYLHTNIAATTNLLEAMVRFKVRNIVFSSTCAVYGNAKYIPVDEEHPTNPANPYGESKKIAETVIHWYGRLKGIRYVILRYFNVCGASDDGLLGDSKNPSSLLVQNAVRGALGIAPFYLTCPPVETPDKTPIRDFINVMDLNEAHIEALKYLFTEQESSIINLGTGKGNSVLEIVHTVEKITGKKIVLKKTKPRLGDYAKTVANINKAKQLLKWKPKRTISDSITSLILWYKKHPNGWNRI